jgi:hypothetical protein
MIKNTNADCKIKDIKISGSTAYVTLIIASSKATSEPRVFNFYIEDASTKERTLLSNYNYWIDRYNNYNRESINIDINLYKQITLQVDITNQNTSEMLENKWLRDCYIILVDVTDKTYQDAWYSERLELVSKEIELPTLQDIRLITNSNYNLNISWLYKYESQDDFNYNNTNLYTTLIIKSPYTYNVLETLDLFASNTNSERTEIECMNIYDSPIIVENLLNNLKGTILSKKEIFYTPVPRQTTGYIKTAKGVKRVIAYYAKLRGDN